MPVFKDEERNTFYVKTYYTDYTGAKKQKMKRGFKLQREAKEWEQGFLSKQSAQPSMPFRVLADLYLEDKKAHCKLITYETKKNRIDTWILPYFNRQPLNSIDAKDIRKWQSDLKEATGQTGKPLSPGYMQNLVTELSSIFNFAIRFYGLSVNPCVIAGNAVGKKQKSLSFWTKDEFDRFIQTFEKDDPYYTAFLILYFCGLRIGELEALTVADIDLEQHTLSVNKTYHLINGKGITTTPKTAKANRVILLPNFLVARIKEYESHIYHPLPDARLFLLSHSSYARTLETHTETAGIKRIRLHDIRHSNASLLIDIGFSALLVSERLGHESVSTTLNIYSHLFPSKQSDVTDKLQQICKGNSYF